MTRLDNKRAQRARLRRSPTAILRLVRGLTRTRARSGIPRRSGNYHRIYAAFNAETNTYSANPLNQYSCITNFAFSATSRETNPIYDLDGNMMTNGVWSYTWDGENRLTSVYSNNTLLVSNTYDHQSRRIAKTTAQGTRTFIWDAWNLIQELITDNGSLTTNYFTWGLDLSGSLQGAGGVGGLLAVHRDGATFFPCFDANGNVTEYIDASGTIRAHYAFDAFGNTISQSGDLASTFSHRFSTKYFNPETSLYYYGYRFYSPELGRWVNRDPLEERGGINQYAALINNGISFFDPFGLKITGKDKIVALKKDYEKNEQVEFKSEKKVKCWLVNGKLKKKKSGKFNVYVVPTAPSEEKNDSTVTAVYEDDTRETFSTSVIRPYRLFRKFSDESYLRDKAPRAVVYIQIFDQFDKPFPKGVMVKETGNIWNTYDNIFGPTSTGDAPTNEKGMVTDTFGCSWIDREKPAHLYITQALTVGDWFAIVATALIWDPNGESNVVDYLGNGTLTDTWLFYGTIEAFFH